jgi:phosphoribosylanthranilate isomerase
MRVGPEVPGEVRVKVCGIRSPEDLTAAEGAEWIGVVIDVPTSPRTRTLEQARGLFRRAEARFGTVAVLVGADAAKVHRVLEEAGPKLVQLHGPLPKGLRSDELGRIVPSLSVPAAGAGPGTLLSPLEGPFPFLHLDSSGGPLPGGTGKVSDWKLCHQLVAGSPGRRFMLAGGLTPSNVGPAIAQVRPFAVDVSSGVESRPGQKSRSLVEHFLQEVQKASGVSSEGAPPTSA